VEIRQQRRVSAASPVWGSPVTTTRGGADIASAGTPVWPLSLELDPSASGLRQDSPARHSDREGFPTRAGSNILGTAPWW
jgi:hypothetical protein